MRIGIIGAGNVGAALGRAWAKAGHEVTYGVRDPSAKKTEEVLRQTGKGSRAATVSEAAAQAEVVVLCTPWQGAQDALRSAGNLSGKVLLDCTNPLKADLSGLELGHTTSGGEQVAAWAPGARVVKIFNTTGSPNMANPKYGKEAATMFFAGNDDSAKAIAGRLAADIGFDPVDAGTLDKARLLEALALLWIHLAFVQKQGTSIAFKLLRR